jgi:transcription initiation factor TFIIH subunit 2
MAVPRQRRKKQRLDDLLAQSSGGSGGSSGKVFEKGMIRYVYIIVDASEAMEVKDLKPSRKKVTMDLLGEFVLDFFDQNPISQLGFIVTRDSVAEKLTELSGNPRNHVAELARNMECSGFMSLQNALRIANDSLGQIPAYGSREILIVSASLGSRDAGNILSTIKALQRNRVRCSVIGLAAQTHIFSLLAEQTGGVNHVAMNRDHFHRLLFRHVMPIKLPASELRKARQWIWMGFPSKVQSYAYPQLCACHNQFCYEGYSCPRCQLKFCELPTDCTVCNLTLASAPHLARSYHHLFPVPTFIDAAAAAAAASEQKQKKKQQHSASSMMMEVEEPEAEDKEEAWASQCFSCRIHMTSADFIRTQCPQCKERFCVECDIYIHSKLHNCPGCLLSDTKP